MPKIGIIVLIYNGLEYLEDCFSSIENLNYPRENLEIIAIDNVSSEPTVEFMRSRFPKINLIVSQKNLGYAGGNNLGIKLALEKNADYIFILNHDTILDKEVLNELIKTFESNSKIGIVQPKILLWPDKTKIQTSGNQIHYLGFGYSGDYKKPDNLGSEIKKIAYASGSGMMVKKEVFREIGLIEEKYFMYHEDLDFGWLARMAGYEIVLNPQAKMYHKYAFSRNAQKYFWMERARGWVILKNYKIPTLILISPALILMELCLILFSLKAGWFKWKIKSYVSFLQGLNWVFKKRKQVQKNRKIGDREVIKYFTGVIKFEDIDNPLISIANLFFNLYFKVIKIFIWW